MEARQPTPLCIGVTVQRIVGKMHFIILFRQTNGAQLLAESGYGGDWSLLILGSRASPASVPGDRYFLGWDHSPPVVGETLHHVGHSSSTPQTYARGTVSRIFTTGIFRGNVSVNFHEGAITFGSSGFDTGQGRRRPSFVRPHRRLVTSQYEQMLCYTSKRDRKGLFFPSLRPLLFNRLYADSDVQHYLGSATVQKGGRVSGNVVVSLASSAIANEGNAGETNTLTFTLSRSGDVTGAMSFNWKTFVTSGTSLLATSGRDFMTVPSRAGVFDAGQRTTTVEVTVIGDADKERDEVVIIDVVNSKNHLLGKTPRVYSG